MSNFKLNDNNEDKWIKHQDGNVDEYYDSDHKILIQYLKVDRHFKFHQLDEQCDFIPLNKVPVDLIAKVCYRYLD